MLLQFNINDYVKVKLTTRGRTILRQNHFKLVPHLSYNPPEADEDGWTEFQLWDLMSQFGAHMHNGCDVPFETTIKMGR